MKEYIIFIIGLILGFLITYTGYDFFQQPDINEILVRDTIIQTVQSEPVILEKVKMRIVYSNDTIIQTYPFTAMIDTVIIRDTLNASYKFPENIFSLVLKRPQDTIKTIYNLAMPQPRSDWKDNLIYFGAGVLSGGLIISLVK